MEIARCSQSSWHIQYFNLITQNDPDDYLNLLMYTLQG